MKDLTGYMSINGKDAWTEDSAFLCEDKQDDNFNFGELLKTWENEGLHSRRLSGTWTVKSCRMCCRLLATRLVT
ncbi:MAG: hypothetical protein V8Q76_01350 [Bacteroides intestinalis]